MCWAEGVGFRVRGRDFYVCFLDFREAGLVS